MRRYDIRDHRLDTLPLVVIRSTRAHAYHAPTGDGVAICGPHTGRRTRIDEVPPSAKPCDNCFTERVVEEYSARDAVVPLRREE